MKDLVLDFYDQDQLLDARLPKYLLTKSKTKLQGLKCKFQKNTEIRVFSWKTAWK